MFDIVLVGSGEAALCAAGAAARVGASTALLQNKVARRASTASICNIPNFVWRRLDLHEYDLSIAPVSARVTLLPGGASVVTHRGRSATEKALATAQNGDHLVWSDFLHDMRTLDDKFQVKGLTREGGSDHSLLDYLDGDERNLSALEQYTGGAVSLLDDYLDDASLKAHLVAHALAPSGLGGGEAGSAAGLSEFLNDEAWRVRSDKGVKTIFQALESVCKKSGVVIFDSAFQGVSSASGKNHVIQLADGETIKTKALVFATPNAALAAGFRAPQSPMAGHGGARAQLHIQLKSPMSMPVGDHAAIFQIVDRLEELQPASDANVDGRLPDKLPVEFEIADNGDILAQTSYCPRAFREEDGWREWTGQDRQAVTRLILDRLSSRLDGLSDNIKKTNIKITGSISPDALIRTDEVENIYIQPYAHNSVAAAVRLVDRVLGK